MTRAFIFPGQGSQSIGMGKALADGSAAARDVFAEVDAALGEKLSELMFAGDIATLTLTENAQPALMAASVAAARTVAERTGRSIADLAGFVAGHSLGEYSALAAAGAISVADAARLLRLRGLAMQKAVPVGVGAMAALLGLDLEQARDVATRATTLESICATANDNAVGQVVVSGHKEAVERAIALAAELGAKRSILLPVSAPFHCPLMAPAAEAMRAALAEVEIKAPAVPVIANVTAAPVTAPDEIRRLLVDQVTGTVRWRESVLYMKSAGVQELVELGAGKVLAGLAKRIDRDLAAVSLQTPEEIDAWVAGIGAA
ncbi:MULTISPECIES: ACP S-malonyltransferase [Inquilinus]|uniref:Malonyl CoA-acyl carrier protein transacylase n=1 Tax=Inquilinus ginsengisoli TaxID=363840 RepID=A0ABU1JW11_9PROT|nr:ACP S-malonyltransferase [Inquilinus ginsengisoli]MDR6292810.1 [acyl-carrier-protein] S-malonyltransferase [Inquilinus ginsengisoli]